MDPHTYCLRTNACDKGRAFATQFTSMYEVWHACNNPAWLAFMYMGGVENTGPEWSTLRDSVLTVINTFRKQHDLDEVFATGLASGNLNFTQRTELSNLIRANLPCPFKHSKPVTRHVLHRRNIRTINTTLSVLDIPTRRAFWRNLRKRIKQNKECTYTEIATLAHLDFDALVLAAFVWIETPEGHTFWQNIKYNN